MIDKNVFRVEALKTKYITELVNYWLNSDQEYLRNIGVDTNKIPSANGFQKKFLDEIMTPRADKKSMLLFWKKEDTPIGHCNLNEIEYGKTANLHLHIWNQADRKTGAGTYLLNESVALFFINLKLEKIYCEPIASNAAANKILEKLGFSFIQKIRKASSNVAEVHDLNQWVISKEDFFKNEPKHILRPTD